MKSISEMKNYLNGLGIYNVKDYRTYVKTHHPDKNPEFSQEFAIVTSYFDSVYKNPPQEHQEHRYTSPNNSPKYSDNIYFTNDIIFNQ